MAFLLPSQDATPCPPGTDAAGGPDRFCRGPGKIIVIVICGIERDEGRNDGKKPWKGVSGFGYGGVAETDDNAGAV